MLTSKLRRVEGSTMLPMPAEILKTLDLRAGDKVALAVEDGRLIVEPRPRPRHTLAELLAASDYSEPQPPEVREWIDARAFGRELP